MQIEPQEEDKYQRIKQLTEHWQNALGITIDAKGRKSILDHPIEQFACLQVSIAGINDYLTFTEYRTHRQKQQQMKAKQIKQSQQSNGNESQMIDLCEEQSKESTTFCSRTTTSSSSSSCQSILSLSSAKQSEESLKESPLVETQKSLLNLTLDPYSHMFSESSENPTRHPMASPLSISSHYKRNKIPNITVRKASTLQKATQYPNSYDSFNSCDSDDFVHSNHPVLIIQIKFLQLNWSDTMDCLEYLLFAMPTHFRWQSVQIDCIGLVKADVLLKDDLLQEINNRLIEHKQFFVATGITKENDVTESSKSTRRTTSHQTKESVVIEERAIGSLVIDFPSFERGSHIVMAMLWACPVERVIYRELNGYASPLRGTVAEFISHLSIRSRKTIDQNVNQSTGQSSQSNDPLIQSAQSLNSFKGGCLELWLREPCPQLLECALALFSGIRDGPIMNTRSLILHCLIANPIVTLMQQLISMPPIKLYTNQPRRRLVQTLFMNIQHLRIPLWPQMNPHNDWNSFFAHFPSLVHLELVIDLSDPVCWQWLSHPINKQALSNACEAKGVTLGLVLGHPHQMIHTMGVKTEAEYNQLIPFMMPHQLQQESMLNPLLMSKEQVISELYQIHNDASEHDNEKHSSTMHSSIGSSQVMDTCKCTALNGMPSRAPLLAKYASVVRDNLIRMLIGLPCLESLEFDLCWSGQVLNQGFSNMLNEILKELTKASEQSKNTASKTSLSKVNIVINANSYGNDFIHGISRQHSEGYDGNQQMSNRIQLHMLSDQGKEISYPCSLQYVPLAKDFAKFWLSIVSFSKNKRCSSAVVGNGTGIQFNLINCDNLLNGTRTHLTIPLRLMNEEHKQHTTDTDSQQQEYEEQNATNTLNTSSVLNRKFIFAWIALQKTGLSSAPLRAIEQSKSKKNGLRWEVITELFTDYIVPKDTGLMGMSTIFPSSSVLLDVKKLSIE